MSTYPRRVTYRWSGNDDRVSTYDGQAVTVIGRTRGMLQIRFEDGTEDLVYSTQITETEVRP